MSRLRALVVSNLYPPHHLGGYELACADVVRALSARGHDVTVVTSWRGLRGPAVRRRRPKVLRLLKTQFWWDARPKSRATEAAWQGWNRAALQVVLRAVRPDVVHVFSPSGLGALLLDYLHTQPIPVVHDVSDTWLLSAYEGDAWFRPRQGVGGPLLRRLVPGVAGATASRLLPARPAAIDLRKSYFRSRFLRERLASAGLEVGDAPVIYHGVELGAIGRPTRRGGAPGIIFSGRLSPEKGVSVLLEALARLRDDPCVRGARTTLAGPVTRDDYGHRLRALAEGLAASLPVRFTGRLPRAQALELLREHDVFAFPVLWEEPFSIALLEAMAVPLAVVATNTGGTPEVLADGENSLIVPKGDPAALAEALRALLRDAPLRCRLADGAYRTVQRFRFDDSLDAIERHLRRIGGKP